VAELSVGQGRAAAPPWFFDRRHGARWRSGTAALPEASDQSPPHLNFCPSSATVPNPAPTLHGTGFTIVLEAKLAPHGHNLKKEQKDNIDTKSIYPQSSKYKFNPHTPRYESCCEYLLLNSTTNQKLLFALNLNLLLCTRVCGRIWIGSFVLW